MVYYTSTSIAYTRTPVAGHVIATRAGRGGRGGKTDDPTMPKGVPTTNRDPGFTFLMPFLFLYTLLHHQLIPCPCPCLAD